MTVSGFGGDIGYGEGGYGSFAYGVDAGATSATFTAVNARLLQGYRVAADPASLVLTGVNASVLATRMLFATPATAAFTPQDARGLATRLLLASPTSIAMTTVNVGLGTGLYVVLGSFEITGSQTAPTTANAYTLLFTSQVVTSSDGDLTPYGWVVDLLTAGAWSDLADPSGSWVELSEPAAPAWT